jgi:GAF domain-containing protein/HAMP domain-containing protein
MNLLSPNEILQLVAWLLALTEFIVGLYVLLLNVRHTANRHVSVFLLISALNTLAMGQIYGATDIAQATWPTALMAIVSPANGPWLLILPIVLLKPDWPRSRWYWRWIWRSLYGLTFLPVVLTLVDLALGTRLWYTGLQAQTYTGGFVSLSQYAVGSLSQPIKVLDIYAMPVIAIIPLVYIALRDSQVSPLTRRLARLLLGVQITVLVIQLGLRSLLSGGMSTLITATIFALAYAYASLQQMISERRGQRGRLQVRLTALILVVTAPLLVAVTLFVTNQAGKLLEQDAADRLHASRSTLESSTSVWLDLNIKALKQLVNVPDIISMDAAQQKPVLQALAVAFPHMYLVSTTDLNGINVARNDAAALTNYSDRQWFRGVRDGAPLMFQTLIGRTNNKPALVVSMPITRSGRVVGVGMFATELTKLTESIKTVQIGKTGYAYIVDANNQVVAHTHPESLTTQDNQLVDAGSFPAVRALRQGTQGGYLAFTDEQGVRWRADIAEMEYGWGIVVQQQEGELFGALRLFQAVSWTALVVGAVLLSVLAWLTIRQAFQPIGTLTETATAITAGDLTRTAPAESEDEFGTLARAFNSMTAQLRGLIGGLEQRVAERTADLERHSRYLEAAAQVGQAASSILESDQLIRQAVELIRERFNLYYVGLFLVDETNEWAVLRAGMGASSAHAAGRAMLARGHRLQIGSGSMIGWSIANARARVALEAGADAMRLATKELPDTRSEAALPLRSRGRVLGALTVQSSQPGAFDQDAIVVLQTMADQVAVALDNARLFAESQSALEAMRRASGKLSQTAWAELLHARPDLREAYRSAVGGVTEAADIWSPEMEQAIRKGQTIRAEKTGDGTRLPVAVPIKVRGHVLGVLDTFKSGQDWTPEEIATLEMLADQVGVALESARLFQDTQRRAAREQLTREITDKMRRAVDLDTLLRTTVQEMAAALGTSGAFVQLLPPSESASGEKQGEAYRRKA